jgi:hypothetical protein
VFIDRLNYYIIAKHNGTAPIKVQKDSYIWTLKMWEFLSSVHKGEINKMQQLVILLLINCSSTCFGRPYAHHQEVKLRFTAYGFLSCCSCCDVEESVGKLCGVG